jgi:hypothetical protein
LCLISNGDQTFVIQLSLGDAWTVSRDEMKHQPHFASMNIDFNQPYMPVFYDGWAPNLAAIGAAVAAESNDLSRLAFSTAAQFQQQQQQQQQHQLQQQSHSHQHQNQHPTATKSHHHNQHHNHQTASNSPKTNNNANITTTSKTGTSKTSSSSSNNTNPNNESVCNTSMMNQSKQQQQQNSPRHEDMKKWAVDLIYRGVKVYEV